MPLSPPPDRYDVIIVGGGPAGLSAALVLGRCRRRIFVADDGGYRNAPAPAAKSVFTRDGMPPEMLLRIGRTQLEPYDVTLRHDRVVALEQDADGFSADLKGGERIRSRMVLLATGIVDLLPEIEGFKEKWGRSVLHCPYCHGWEVRDEPVALYGSGTTGYNLVGLVRGWARDLILFTDGPAELSDAQQEHLERLAVPVREERVVRLTGEGDNLEGIELDTGETVSRSALFLKPPQRPHSNLAHRLGADLTDDGDVNVDDLGATSIPGLYVAGDAGPNVRQVISAAASGANVAIEMNENMLRDEFDPVRED